MTTKASKPGDEFWGRETGKAYDRRFAEGFFDKYCQGRGIDIGCGNDPVTPIVERFDESIGSGDAHDMIGPPRGEYDFVYSSHCLEHLGEPVRALKTWAALVKPGGYLIFTVPSRDHYEKKEEPPSRWNGGHVNFFVEDRHLKTNVLGVKQIVEEAVAELEIIYIRLCIDGFTITDPEQHSDGEFSFEVVLRKRLQ
jgi:SAM-dependent methyltransferase